MDVLDKPGEEEAPGSCCSASENTNGLGISSKVVADTTTLASRNSVVLSLSYNLELYNKFISQTKLRVIKVFPFGFVVCG